MRIEKNIDVILSEPCVVALGCFDGVHKGHKRVLSEARALADDAGISLTVFSFSSPTRNYFKPHSVPTIIPCEQKQRIFAELGVDVSVSVEPSAEIFNMSAEDFVNDVIIHRLNARHVVCGFNYSFGKGGVGNADMLGRLCKCHDVGVTVIPEQTVGGRAVSSSAIREAVTSGDVETASLYLGRPFSVSALVVNGQHLARKLGFPTVNIIPDSTSLLPKNGVYVSRVRFDGEERYGITNVGLRPTVDTNILCAETHIFDFCGDLYGKEITVEFLKFLRPETKFESVERLAEQVELDIAKAREFISQ